MAEIEPEARTVEERLTSIEDILREVLDILNSPASEPTPDLPGAN